MSVAQKKVKHKWLSCWVDRGRLKTVVAICRGPLPLNNAPPHPHPPNTHRPPQTRPPARNPGRLTSHPSHRHRNPPLPQQISLLIYRLNAKRQSFLLPSLFPPFAPHCRLHLIEGRAEASPPSPLASSLLNCRAIDSTTDRPTDRSIDRPMGRLSGRSTER